MIKIRVIGVGNLLLGDEGIGIHAIEALAGQKLPPEVELVDAGTAGLGLLNFLEDVEKVIFIDAADMSLPPGAIRRFQPEDVRDSFQYREMSLHETGLLNILALAQRTGQYPAEVVIYGIQPQRLETSLELSPVCRDALRELTAKVLEELGRPR